jgi:hypothetical protein
MIAWWQRMKSRLVSLLGADVDAVRKLDKLDQHHREIGHRLRNMQARNDAIKRLVSTMRTDSDGRDEDGHRIVH